MTLTIDLKRRELEKLLDFYDRQKDFVAEQQAGYVRVIPTFFTIAALEKFATKHARGYFYRGYELIPEKPQARIRG